MHDIANRVRTFIDEFTPTDPLLPLTHVTTMYGFRSIMAGMTLDPSECSIFEEELLYLFYGRPAYRATQVAASKLNWNLPIAFIIKPESVKSIKRVFPFDSGAFQKGYYGNVFHKDALIKSFNLNPTLVSAAKYTTAFYSNNHHYYQGKSDTSLDLDNLDFELQGMSYLAKQPGMQMIVDERRSDERASAVEIQIAHSLTIADSLLGLIVPETLLTHTAFLDAIARWEISDDQIMSYPEILGPGSEAWVGVFYEKVLNLYRENGYL